MLVLSRKTADSGKGKKNPKLTIIRIGPDITVTVLKASGDNVRIGIQAPEGVSVLRGEIDDSSPPAACHCLTPCTPRRKPREELTS